MCHGVRSPWLEVDARTSPRHGTVRPISSTAIELTCRPMSGGGEDKKLPTRGRRIPPGGGRFPGGGWRLRWCRALIARGLMAAVGARVHDADGVVEVQTRAVPVG